MAHAVLFLRTAIDLVLCPIRGVVVAALRRVDAATRRGDSSLHSHQAWRSQCRNALSGPDKTLFASVGPNSRRRGYVRTTTVAARMGQRNEGNWPMSRIKAHHGRRLERPLAIANAAEIPPRVVSVFRALRRPARLDSIFRLFGPRPVLGSRGGKRGSSHRRRNIASGSQHLLSGLSFSLGPVSVGKMIRSPASFVQRSFWHHGIKCSQRPQCFVP